jgi:hypothetical protein
MQPMVTGWTWACENVDLEVRDGEVQNSLESERVLRAAVQGASVESSELMVSAATS